jgi:hypothetical protein
MADGTPGFGRMVAVVGAIHSSGSSHRAVCKRSAAPSPNPHVLAAQDLLDRASTSAERAGGNRLGVSLIGIRAWVAITDQSR